MTDREPPRPRRRPGPRGLLALAMLLLAAILVARTCQEEPAGERIPYSELVQLLRDKRIKEVVIRGDQIRGERVEPVDGRQRFVTTRVDPELAELLDKAGVRYSEEPTGTSFWVVISWLWPLLFLGVLWFLLLRRAGGAAGGLMAIGKSRAKVYVETDTKVTFSDVAGVDEATAELAEIVAFLKDPREFGVLGARMPKGVLLVGPPGTGKTLLARAVAGEAGVPFFSISGSEFVEMFVGVGAARVRDLFEQARQTAPCIIFIDELDALGRARMAAPFAGGHDEKEQTLNQLLVELDGFDPAPGIVLLAATNRPEILDRALLRAGRFDRQILVDRPDRAGRAAILAVHSEGVVLEPGLDLDAVAALTPGFTGADLENLINEAALVATRRGADAVSLDDVTRAIERIVGGLERRSRILNPREREVIAHHEMGHALVARSCPTCDPVHKVSIIPRGIGALGFTMQRPTEDRYLMTEAELLDKMSVLLGGRAAEKLVFDQLSTGASDDLARASELARAMVTEYGMAIELGPASYPSRPAAEWPLERSYGEETASAIDRATRRLVTEAFDRALDILERHRGDLERGAALLLERETLTGDELAALLDDAGRARDESIAPI